MGNYLCHEQPDLYEFDARVLEARRRVRIELAPERGVA